MDHLSCALVSAASAPRHVCAASSWRHGITVCSCASQDGDYLVGILCFEPVHDAEYPTGSMVTRRMKHQMYKTSLQKMSRCIKHQMYKTSRVSRFTLNIREIATRGVTAHLSMSCGVLNIQRRIDAVFVISQIGSGSWLKLRCVPLRGSNHRFVLHAKRVLWPEA
jgi:hypothetical protein